MERNTKIALIVLGVAVTGVLGYMWYRKWRMTSGNALKDGRVTTIKRVPATELQNVEEDIL